MHLDLGSHPPGLCVGWHDGMVSDVRRSRGSFAYLPACLLACLLPRKVASGPPHDACDVLSDRRLASAPTASPEDIMIPTYCYCSFPKFDQLRKYGTSKMVAADSLA